MQSAHPHPALSLHTPGAGLPLAGHVAAPSAPADSVPFIKPHMVTESCVAGMQELWTSEWQKSPHPAVDRQSPQSVTEVQGFAVHVCPSPSYPSRHVHCPELQVAWSSQSTWPHG